MVEKIIHNILDCKKKSELKDVIWKASIGIDLPRTTKLHDLKICILNAPCNGFGDLVFAIRLSSFLESWYGCNVSIVTPLKEQCTTLGKDPLKIYKLLPKYKNTQCRRFEGLSFETSLPKQDLFFVAPVNMDMDPKLNDIQKLIPYANLLNTFFFSEYNDTIKKNFDFHMGIGNERLGLFIRDVCEQKIPSLDVPLSNIFALAYINDQAPNHFTCIRSFLEMISKKFTKGKYGDSKTLDIIVPKWYQVNRKTKEMLNKYFGKITIFSRDKKNKLIQETISIGNVSINIRKDVLPVNTFEMLWIIENSINDILITGDQSLTDVLSCAPYKNIFYQIVPWKINFAKELTKRLPNKYYSSTKTSCGGLHAIKYHPKYGKFIDMWKFDKLGKKKLDAIILSILFQNVDKNIIEIKELILKTKYLSTLKNIFYED